MKIERLGPYRIGKLLGSGGMGKVYTATRDDDDQVVAIKVLNPSLSDNDDFRERFEAEIESLRKLNHPNIVRLFGFGEHDGHLFYAMEQVDGRSLDDELASRRPFDWREITDIGIQLARALKHAHDHGVIHRDLKPANVLLTPDDEAKLLDFGIAKLFGASSMTMAGGVLGTADYMSPEQADGQPVTDRCDQYSLGGVLYTLGAGRPPFTSTSLPKLLQLHRFTAPEPLSELASDLPEDLCRIIMQLLEKDPRNRFPNMQVLARHMAAMRRSLVVKRDETGFQVSVPMPSGTVNKVELGETRLLGKSSAEAESMPDGSNHVSSSPGSTISGAKSDQSPDGEVVALPGRENRYTVVSGQLPDEQAGGLESGFLRLVQITLLGSALALLVGLAWYLMQPASADGLFATIDRAASGPNAEHLERVDAEIEEFLARFPDDPRSDLVTVYQQEIALRKAARKLRGRALLTRPRQALRPAEQMYLEAMRLMELDPSQARQMLSTLVTLYQDEPGLSSAEQQCLALARRELARTKPVSSHPQTAFLAVLEERLAAADAQRESSPEQAREAYQALVDVSHDLPWARTFTDTARQRLKDLRGTQNGDSDSP